MAKEKTIYEAWKKIFSPNAWKIREKRRQIHEKVTNQLCDDNNVTNKYLNGRKVEEWQKEEIQSQFKEMNFHTD